MKKLIPLGLIFTFGIMSCVSTGVPTNVSTNVSTAISTDVPVGVSTSVPAAVENLREKTKELYAIFKTSKGEIVCKLYEDETPKTVENFVGLAKGKKEWEDPKTGKKRKRSLYKKSIFHRVMPDFMIQGGCPLGTGYGGPGYQFEDEIVPELMFDKPGKLAMANAGPNTNGSQFFITVARTPWLNGKHTIFGEVIQGQEVVNEIANVPRDERNKPLQKVILEKVKIKRRK